MRLIDADALMIVLSAVAKDYESCGDVVKAKAAMCAAKCLATESVSPTLDYEPVRHGEWKETGCNTFCRSCGEKPLYDYFGKIKLSHYCPNCGTKMDGGKRNAKVD